MQNNSEKKIDRYLDHLEFLSSKIADNISMGLFQDVNKMDYERKAIINTTRNSPKDVIELLNFALSAIRPLNEKVNVTTIAINKVN